MIADWPASAVYALLRLHDLAEEGGLAQTEAQDRLAVVLVAVQRLPVAWAGAGGVALRSARRSLLEPASAFPAGSLPNDNPAACFSEVLHSLLLNVPHVSCVE